MEECSGRVRNIWISDVVCFGWRECQYLAVYSFSGTTVGLGITEGTSQHKCVGNCTLHPCLMFGDGRV
jgi:hypothetical protein